MQSACIFYWVCVCVCLDMRAVCLCVGVRRLCRCIAMCLRVCMHGRWWCGITSLSLLLPPLADSCSVIQVSISINPLSHSLSLSCGNMVLTYCWKRKPHVIFVILTGIVYYWSLFCESHLLNHYIYLYLRHWAAATARGLWQYLEGWTFRSSLPKKVVYIGFSFSCLLTIHYTHCHHIHSSGRCRSLIMLLGVFAHERTSA